MSGLKGRAALEFLAAVARAGRAGRLLGPVVALQGVARASDVHRVRAQVRDLSSLVAAGRSAFYRGIWESAATRLGASVRPVVGDFLEITRGTAATIVRENLVELDNPVTLELAGDREASAQRLEAAGLPVAPRVRFTLSTAAAARAFLAENGPSVVKPARGTGAGAGVTCDVRSEEELARAALNAVRFCPELVIERQLTGAEHRLLVLDGVVVGAVRREVPAVVGDGSTSVVGLMLAENQRRAAAHGTEGLFLLALSLDAVLALRRQGLRPASVPAAGQRVAVAGTVNAGAPSDCCAEAPTPALAAAAVAAAAALRLRWASVEIACHNPDTGLGGVIEVNSTPGFSYHYQVRDPATVRPVAEPLLDALLQEGPRSAGGSLEAAGSAASVRL